MRSPAPSPPPVMEPGVAGWEELGPTNEELTMPSMWSRSVSSANMPSVASPADPVRGCPLMEGSEAGFLLVLRELVEFLRSSEGESALDGLDENRGGG